jgi:hypothetical protein
MSPRRVVPSVLLTALALVASGAPAHAAAEDSRDARRDVVSRNAFSDARPVRVEPDRRVGDVVRTQVSLGGDVVVTTTLRSLAAQGHQEFHWTVVTSADEAPGGWTGVLVYNASKRGQFTFFDPLANDPGCARARVDRPARTVTLTVPASCLGDPVWVRVGSGTVTLADTPAGVREYRDDARRTGVSLRAWKLGPQVTEG